MMSSCLKCAFALLKFRCTFQDITCMIKCLTRKKEIRLFRSFLLISSKRACPKRKLSKKKVHLIPTWKLLFVSSKKLKEVDKVLLEP